MSAIRLLRALRTSATLIAFAAFPLGAQAAASPPPNAGLYTSYSIGSDYQNVTWTVCGTTQTTEGCYGTGTLGPFAHAAALIESSPVVDVATGTVTRYIYLADNQARPPYNDFVYLYVYKKVDVVTSSTDTVTVSFVKFVSMRLLGGSGTTVFMAGNENYIYVGTSVYPFAVRIQRTNLSHLVQTAQVSPEADVTAITSDFYGNVTVTFGGATNHTAGSLQFDINGNSLGTPTTNVYMLNTSAALQTSSLPTTDAFPAARMQIRPRQAPAAVQSTPGN